MTHDRPYVNIGNGIAGTTVAYILRIHDPIAIIQLPTPQPYPLDNRITMHPLSYGGGFISYELCDGFAMRKLHTTWLMRGPYWLRNCLDRDGAEVVENIAKKFGVEVICGDEIASVVPKNGVPSYVKTKKGREIQ